MIILEGCQQPGPALNEFMGNWIEAATNVSGDSVKMTAQHPGSVFIHDCAVCFRHAYSSTHVVEPLRLETLESQTELITRIDEAVLGITKARKDLQSLGKTATAAQVQHVLDVEPCFASCWVLVSVHVGY